LNGAYLVEKNNGTMRVCQGEKECNCPESKKKYSGENYDGGSKSLAAYLYLFEYIKDEMHIWREIGFGG